MTRCRVSRAAVGGFSAIYGAFGVLIVSILVAGLIANGATHRSTSRQGQAADADLFLGTVLGSEMDGGGVTLREALSRACLELSCAPGQVPRDALRENLSRVASALALELGASYTLSVSNGSGEWLRLGDHEVGQRASIGHVDVFHRPSGSFIAVSAALTPS